MKKLLLILICLFVSFEVKSKYIVLECEIKKTIYTINDYRGNFIKNIIDTSFDVKTLYLDEKIKWLNDEKLYKKYRDRLKLDKYEFLNIEELDWRWILDDEEDDYYNYNFRGGWIQDLDIDLNKDSGQLTYTMKYYKNDKWNIYDKHFYKKGYYTNGFVSHGVCKKIKKSLF